MNELAKRYPQTIDCAGTSIELTMLDSLDTNLVKEFTVQLPERDLLFLNRDIREPKVVDAWSKKLASGDITSIAALRKGKIVGTTAVVQDKHSWSVN